MKEFNKIALHDESVNIDGEQNKEQKRFKVIDTQNCSVNISNFHDGQIFIICCCLETDVNITDCSDISVILVASTTVSLSIISSSSINLYTGNNHDVGLTVVDSDDHHIRIMGDTDVEMVLIRSSIIYVDYIDDDSIPMKVRCSSDCNNVEFRDGNQTSFRFVNGKIYKSIDN